MHSVTFWNVRKGVAGTDPIVQLAMQIVNEEKFSGLDGEAIICLAEPGNIDPSDLLKSLKVADVTRPWWVHRSSSDRFIVFGTVKRASIRDGSEAGGGAAFIVTRMDGSQPIVYQLFFVHLASPLGAGNAASNSIRTAAGLRSAIEKHEAQEANGDTLVIGDFNMRPYDEGMVVPLGLHAAPCMHAASKSRTIDGEKYPYFYNPMWELLGNWSTSRQPGTFYWVNKTDATKWHLIDQVIVRPAFAQKLSSGKPYIHTKAGSIELLSKRGAIQKDISDHLPITISLSI